MTVTSYSIKIFREFLKQIQFGCDIKYDKYSNTYYMSHCLGHGKIWKYKKIATSVYKFLSHFFFRKNIVYKTDIRILYA